MIRLTALQRRSLAGLLRQWREDDATIMPPHLGWVRVIRHTRTAAADLHYAIDRNGIVKQVAP